MSDVTLLNAHLQAGGVIAYPTETLWGLGTDAFNEKAVKLSFDIKGRSQVKAMSVLVRDIEMARQLAHFPSGLETFLERVWPGPVTVVLPRKEPRLDSACGGLPTVGLRCSSHPFVRQLVWSYPNPITTTSANQSGQANPTGLADLNWLPEEVLRASESFVLANQPESQGSTVILVDKEIKVLREGDIPGDQLIELAARSVEL